MSHMSELDILIKEGSGMIQPKYEGKWFTSLDHTFCMHGTCRVRHTCRRYYDSYIWCNVPEGVQVSMIRGDVGEHEEGCDLYIGEGSV